MFLQTLNQLANLAKDDFPFGPVHSFNSDFLINISEKDDSYIVQAKLPGVNKEHISLDLKDNILTISVHKEEKQENKTNFIFQEFLTSFKAQRRVKLKNIDNEKLQAKFENGLLEVNIGKKEPTESKKIVIE